MGRRRSCQRRALHLVSAPFGDPFFRGLRKDAVVAQLVRAPVCGTGGRWFEPTQLYQQLQALRQKSKIVECRLANAIANVCQHSLGNKIAAPSKDSAADCFWL